eukprot:829133-Rhodomonas_salina.3
MLNGQRKVTSHVTRQSRLVGPYATSRFAAVTSPQHRGFWGRRTRKVRPSGRSLRQARLQASWGEPPFQLPRSGSGYTICGTDAASGGCAWAMCSTDVAVWDAEIPADAAYPALMRRMRGPGPVLRERMHAAQ